MNDYTISQQFALIGLDGLEVLHKSAAKSAVLSAIAMAQFLDGLISDDQMIEEFKIKLTAALDSVKNLKKKDALALETNVADTLKAAGVLEEIPDLLGCDMDYYTSGVEIKAYRCDKKVYTGITERIKAEILEDGPVTKECICMVWLLRESGCLHDIFSIAEQTTLERRMLDLAGTDDFCGVLWNADFHSSLTLTVKNLLQGKSNLFRNPYLEGVNLLFPFLDRRRAIFVDYVILGTNVQNRRLAMLSFLSERGHYTEEVKRGDETMLKIDNAYYRIWPKTISISYIPIQGANLLPVYE